MLGTAHVDMRGPFLAGKDGMPVIMDVFGVGFPSLIHGLRVLGAELRSE